MNVVLIGSGGREHAIAQKLSESELLDDLFIIPGNPGTSKYGKNVELDYSNHF
jgi:phosphoribosylamine--glycine ligase